MTVSNVHTFYCCAVVIAFDKRNETATETVEDATKLETNGAGEQFSDSQPIIDSGKST